jgi:ABC-type glutathione transport system ATPase component
VPGGGGVTPLLTVERLCAGYAGRPVLRDVSLTVGRGEIVAVVGGSGSGKSTLGRVIAGLLAPTSGVVRVEGDARGRVQLMFQDPYASLNPVHSVVHHVARPLLLHGRATAADVRGVAAALLESVGLRPASDYLDLLPGSLSGGQRQRVALARALAPGPALLVADEPTSMLDLSLRGEVLGLLRRRREEDGLAVLLITHDLASAAWLSDRVVVLEDGAVVEAGVTLEVLGAPRHAVTRVLVG